jgi:hypothetical protein
VSYLIHGLMKRGELGQMHALVLRRRVTAVTAVGLGHGHDAAAGCVEDEAVGLGVHGGLCANRLPQTRRAHPCRGG